MTPKIFLYCYEMEGWSDVMGAAIAEDGTGLAGHLSSNEQWSQYDMTQAPGKVESYTAHYPNGYELVWLGYEPNLEQYPELAAALKLNQANKVTA